ncbi:MAG: rhamnogalacturonan acetylesterase [Planctomycetes bacterium]|nr:rhamnogalacturonan acetylesterase [Planctomycetota bacterium]
MKIAWLVLPAILVTTAVIADEPARKVHIVLVGDSTVTDTAGWGGAFIKHLGPSAEGVNLARGGRSSKSFRDEGTWKKAIEQKPDYVLIQFGHNDQPGKGPERETDPATTYRDFLRQYVDEARAIGTKPILITSVVRRTFNAEGKIESSLVPYANAVKAVAAEKNVPVIDLHQRSLELMNQLGPAEAEKFGPPHPTRPGKFDGTHFNEMGAERTAELVISELVKVEPAAKAWFPPR